MPGTPAPSLDAARDELYGVPPSDFVAERARLAKEIRAGGDADLAKEVGALRRPSLAAWSVNQAARTDPSRVARLFAAGEGLSGATGGKHIREAGRRRRDLIDELTDTALRFAGTLSANAETHRDAIDATWEAASIDPAVQPTVASGWLEKELPRPSGFGPGAPDASGTDASLSTRAAVGKRARLKPAPPPDELARRRAEATFEIARASLRAADDDAAEAERARAAARQTADDAARRVTDLERTVTAARADAREALSAAKDAERRAVRARSVQERAARQADKAQQDLERR